MARVRALNLPCDGCGKPWGFHGAYDQTCPDSDPKLVGQPRFRNAEEEREKSEQNSAGGV